MERQLRELLNRWNTAKQKNTEGSMALVLTTILRQMNHYMQKQSPQILQNEINEVLTRSELNVLRGAGAKGVVCDMVNAQRLRVIGASYIVPRDLYKYGTAVEASG